jgi:PadR family transcriptional regulator, regulatory protein PadR
MQESRNIVLSTVEELVLSALISHELYGLEIIKAVQEATEGKRRIGFGSLYPALHQLQKRGMVKSRWGDETPRERSGARRKYYEITNAGVAALKEAEAIRARLLGWKPLLGRV